MAILAEQPLEQTAQPGIVLDNEQMHRSSS
jgi:hypothetical protein